MARGDEKRAGGRVRFLKSHVAVIVKGKRVLADLKNLARGGARFSLGEVAIASGDAVTLIIPTPAAAALKVAARVVRLQERDEQRDVAVSFTNLSPTEQDRLQQIVEHIALATRDGQRANPRLSARLEAEVAGRGEPAIVEDVSRGGVVFQVRDAAPAPRERLEVVLRDPSTGQRLPLAGRVVYTSPADQGSRIGVKFLSPSRQQREGLDRLILSLLR